MKHIVLCLPTVMACHAMKVLLDEYIFTGKNDVREVIVAVENTASIEFKTQKNQGIGYRSPEAQTTNSLNNFLNKCESQGKQTITLTVTKYMTAVSIPLWDSMFYMKDTQSTQEYDQNIFRICTRNVQQIFDKNGKLIDAVNLKPNVYLIDFKIQRLFEVIQDSTRRQNTINGKLTAQDIEQTVKRNLKNMPIYIDSDINGKLSEMKELTAKDFMKYYIQYNSERSIEETINIGKFDTVLHGNKLDAIINLFDKTHINKSQKTSAYTEDNPTSSPEMPDNNIPDEDDTYTNRKKKKQRDLILEDKKKRFKTFIKNILYFAMCLGGAEGLQSIIKQMEDNKEIEKMGDRFALTIDMLKTLDKNLNFIEHNELDAEIYNILMLYTDNSKKPIDKIKTLCKRIGQLGPQEVATPPELCKHMVKKINSKTIKKAESILLINEKYGEFLIAIQEIYGKEVANKCKIVPSSEMGYMFCKKTIKDLELKTNILDIDDYNKNGYYDIEDWLLCPSQKLIEENMGKKFDICLMNPPYDGETHLKFLQKAIQVADNVVSIQPIRWLEEVVGKDKKSSYYNKYEESISKHIKDLETITAENAKILFDIVANMDLGIYICNNYGGFDYKKLSENSIINKVLIYIKENLCNIELNKKDGYRVKVPFIGIGKSIGKTSKPQPPRLAGLDRYNIKNIVYKDGQYNGKWWYEYYNRNQHSKLTEEITSSIKFDTEEEGYNFIKSVQKTDFGRYVESFLITDVNISNQKILWMGNAKNPRTGEIGYKTEWLDEDFDKFFELTEDEIKMYHKYISDFEKSVIKWKDEHVKK